MSIACFRHVNSESETFVITYFIGGQTAEGLETELTCLSTQSSHPLWPLQLLSLSTNCLIESSKAAVNFQPNSDIIDLWLCGWSICKGPDVGKTRCEQLVWARLVRAKVCRLIQSLWFKGFLTQPVLWLKHVSFYKSWWRSSGKRYHHLSWCSS